MVTLPIVKLSLVPLTAILASPTKPTVPVDSFNLDPRTLTNALGLNPTSEKAAAEKEVAPKYMRDYLAVTGISLVPTND